MNTESLAELLDEVAAFVFDGEAGAARLAPLLDRWNEEVGQIREDDAQRELLQAMRTDWALCDVPTHGGRPWLAAALEGALGPVPDRWRVLARNHVGLFEIFPGKVSWFRDLRAGLCVPVLDPLPLQPEEAGPAALWEARVVLDDGTAVLARAPLACQLRGVDLLNHHILGLAVCHGVLSTLPQLLLGCRVF